MNLSKIIKKAEELEIEIVRLEGYQEPGRLIEIRGRRFIFLNAKSTEIEEANIILHEIAHLTAGDLDSQLAQVPSYMQRTEHLAESERIIDFMSFINEEYPIDQDFDYISYMTNAQVPSQYEKLVKETANKLYQENIKKKRI